MELPSAIIFVNADITDAIKNILITQLDIVDSMDGYEFDARVIADPNYPQIIHLNHWRILVKRDTFQQTNNFNIANVVMFVKQGQASILKNNFGSPGLTLPIQRINVYNLLRAVGSSEVVILPSTPSPPLETSEDPLLNDEEGFGAGGIVAEELRDTSDLFFNEEPDEDDNSDFINRK